jgi:hypothetical protein
MELQVHSSASWFFGDKTVSVQCAAELPTDVTPALFLHRCHSLIPSLFSWSPGDTLVNRRGKQFVHDHEELLFVSGQVENDDADEDQPKITFSVSFKTRFKDFLDGNIRHDVFLEYQGAPWEILGDPNIDVLTNLVPARIQELRLGDERFRRREFGAQIGLAPVLYGRFSADVVERSVKFSIEETFANRIRRVPLAEHTAGFDVVLRELGICNNFQAQIQEKL